MAETYDQQYCEKHNQKYGSHLHECPICRGEKMTCAIPKDKIIKKDKGV